MCRARVGMPHSGFCKERLERTTCTAVNASGKVALSHTGSPIKRLPTRGNPRLRRCVHQWHRTSDSPHLPLPRCKSSRQLRLGRPCLSRCPPDELHRAMLSVDDERTRAPLVLSIDHGRSTSFAELEKNTPPKYCRALRLVELAPEFPAWGFTPRSEA